MFGYQCQIVLVGVVQFDMIDVQLGQCVVGNGVGQVVIVFDQCKVDDLMQQVIGDVGCVVCVFGDFVCVFGFVGNVYQLCFV